MPEQSKDNDRMNDEPSGKKLKVCKPSTSPSTNPVLSTILEFFTSLRIKTKNNSQTIQCDYDNDSFEFILNDSFLNILNVKRKTNFWPQSFHDMNVFLTKVLFLQIFSNFMLNNKSKFVWIFCLNNILNFIDCIYVVQVGENRIFYFQGVPKATLPVDLVIADILKGLRVPGISTPSSSIPSWNAKSNKKSFVFF